jgi:hypothetical protein
MNGIIRFIIIAILAIITQQKLLFKADGNIQYIPFGWTGETSVISIMGTSPRKTIDTVTKQIASSDRFQIGEDCVDCIYYSMINEYTLLNIDINNTTMEIELTALLISMSSHIVYNLENAEHSLKNLAMATRKIRKFKPIPLTLISKTNIEISSLGIINKYFDVRIIDDNFYNYDPFDKALTFTTNRDLVNLDNYLRYIITDINNGLTVPSYEYFYKDLTDYTEYYNGLIVVNFILALLTAIIGSIVSICIFIVLYELHCRIELYGRMINN